MKYSILNLSPGNSLIGWLVGQGRMVFAISWRNPGADMRDTSLDDYRTEGVMAAIDAMQAIRDYLLVLDDVKLPLFVVGTERDHIAPWHSVFKLHLLNDGELTFVLTSGGHNAGTVSEPGHPHRVRNAGARTLGADEWERDTAAQDESWWPAWLDRHSGRRTAPLPMGVPGATPRGDAPGSYVRER